MDCKQCKHKAYVNYRIKYDFIISYKLTKLITQTHNLASLTSTDLFQ